MSQFYSVYVKIKDSVFRPMGLAIGTVYKCNGVVARYMMANGSGDLCNSSGTLIEPSWTPKLDGIVADGTSVVIGYDMAMTTTDETGIVVNVDGTPAAITGAVASGDTIVVTMTSTVGVGTAITVDYDATTGDVANSNAIDALSFNDVVGTNVTV